MTARLLVVAPNWLGDAVMALPALAAVRASRPDQEILVAGRASTVALFSMVEGVSQTVPLQGRGGVAGALHWGDDVAALRAARGDIGVLLPNSFRSAWTAWKAGIPERWGYAADFRGRLLTRSVPRPRGYGRGRTHYSQYYLGLVQALGLSVADGEPVAGQVPCLPRLVPPDEAHTRAARLLEDLGLGPEALLVGLGPGAAYGKAKQWPPGRYAELAVELRRRLGATSLIFGAGADRGTGLEIERALRRRRPVGGSEAAPAVNLAGRTDLALLVALMSRCAAFVSNDSGAMHLAAAAGLPVTAIFGASDERWTSPLPSTTTGIAPHEILTAPAWCRPCMLRECPIDHRCMTRIGAGRVADAVERQVRAGRDRKHGTDS